MNSSIKKINVDKRNRVAITILLFLLAYVGVFGQTQKQPSVTIMISSEEVIKENFLAATDNEIDFMQWFMGSKQNQSSTSKESLKSNTSTKKQLIISGGTPNRVLYRTLLKRVVSIDNALV